METKQTKSRRAALVLLYYTFYILAFAWLEQRPVQLHIIHTSLDQYIPFCEYFIIPYVLWFFYVAATLVYFTLFNESEREFRRLFQTLVLGDSIFLLISFVFPNGQDLRPALGEGGNLFRQAVAALYQVDTPTNIFPSIHAYNAVACCVAILTSKNLGKRRGLTGAAGVLTLLIVFSTLFLKQHTVVDVLAAFLLNLQAYRWLYSRERAEGRQPAGVKRSRRRYQHQ